MKIVFNDDGIFYFMRDALYRIKTYHNQPPVIYLLGLLTWDIICLPLAIILGIQIRKED